MKRVARRTSFALVVTLLVAQVLLVSAAAAQDTPPWGRPGNAFYNNPTGYARDLHRRYVANEALLNSTRASLPTYKRDVTGAEMSTFGFTYALRDAIEVARLRRAAEERIEACLRTRGELEAEWRQWCEQGLLGSPMPPLAAAQEVIEEEYLDTSVSPSPRRLRRVDRIDYNIRQFLEGGNPPTAPAAPAGGGAGGATFPPQPFNGLQITYSISGAALVGAPVDGGPFEGWIRTLGGFLQGGTLSVSGSVTKGTGASKEYPGHATVKVWAGDQTATWEKTLDAGKAESYSVSVNVPAGATNGGVNVHVWGDYRNGEMRFVQVTAKLDAMLIGGLPPDEQAPPPQAPPPQPTALPKASELGEGRVCPLAGALRIVPAGGKAPDGVEIPTDVPYAWQAGDKLVTGPGSQATVIFPDYLRAVMGPSTALELGQGSATLTSGTLLCDLLRPGWTFRLTTPSAIVRAADAVFTAKVVEGGATVPAVGLGTVTVTDSDGANAVALKAGHCALVRTGEPPSAPQALTEDQSRQIFGPITYLEPTLPAAGDGAGMGGAATPATGDVGDLRVGTAVENGELVGEADRFARPTGVKVMYAYADVPTGSVCECTWSRDGELLEGGSRTITIGGTGSVNFGIRTGGERPLPAGTYTATITIGGTIVARKTFVVTE